VFTSPNGADIFFNKLKEKQIDVRSLFGIKFAAIGSATRKAIENRGILVDIMPQHFSSKDLAETLLAEADGDIFLLRSKHGSKILPQVLKEGGKKCTDIKIYETVSEEYQPVIKNMICTDFDYIIFTSHSTVEKFIKIFGSEKLKGATAAAIGKECAASCIKEGMRTIVADNASMLDIVNAITEDVQLNKE
jgi:uroporphyrinogen III methyltransferase/synthase